VRVGGSSDPEIAVFTSSGMGGRDAREFFDWAGEGSGRRSIVRGDADAGPSSPNPGERRLRRRRHRRLRGGVRLHRPAAIEISTLTRRPARESHREAVFQRRRDRRTVAQTIT
jgi:hypothetical protein